MMTNYAGISCPCQGTLEEIHAALWSVGETRVTVNGGWGYTLVHTGFKSVSSGRIYPLSEELETLGITYLHPGTVIVVGCDHGVWCLVTTGKIPHISKRCKICGTQLNPDEITHQACHACYAEEVGQ